MVNLRPSSKP